MRKRTLLALIFLAAFAVRAGFILFAPPRSMAIDDSAQWNRTALRYLSGTGFLENAADLDPKRPPVYPLFLAGTYAVFGAENFTAVKIAQALLGAFICVLIYGLAFLLSGPRTALGSAAACAVYPPLVIYTGILQSETLFTVLLLLFALALVLVRDHSARWPIAAAGIIPIPPRPTRPPSFQRGPPPP
jgi:4-amino-4-deoxy-L-arabinose transferase-like glycosyltransferase